MTDEKFDIFDDLLNIAGESPQPIIRELHKTILAIDPNACEVIRIGDKAAIHGLGPKKNE